MAQMKYKDADMFKPLAPSYKQHTDATTRITALETITDDAKVSAIKEKTFSNLDARLEESEQDLKIHNESTMPHRIENLKTNKTYRYGYQISADGILQLISEEVI